MTEITITANGKPYYHATTTRNLSKKEIKRELREDAKFHKKGVEYSITVKNS